MENQTKKLVGEITNYIFENEDTMYKVCTLFCDDGKEVTITGSFPHLDYGLTYEFLGVFKETKYGEQFQVKSYNKSENYTKNGLISYLSSDKFYGIGKVLATRIVEELGTDCLEKILNNKNVLDDIKIPKAKKEIIYLSIEKNMLEEQVFVKLYSYGLTSKMVERLYSKYGYSASSKIEENPYSLIEDIDGFGFKRCDSLAMNLGMDPNSPKRIRAAITYSLLSICESYGFTFLTNIQLKGSVKKIIPDVFLTDELFESCVNSEIEAKHIVFEDERLYPSFLYYAECKVKSKLLNIAKKKINLPKRDKAKAALEYIESTLNIKYTDMQAEAIINSLTDKLTIITGGPGTGKSTILKGILESYAYLNKLSVGDTGFSVKVLMAAPTGRAAKRMALATNYKATTIHKALGYNITGEFEYNEINPLWCDLLIIDEVSMLDLSLAKNLFSSIKDSTQIILIGDANQLPSVGPGNILADLINTKIFRTTKLTQIMRQAEGSDIIKLSNYVLNKKVEYNIFNNKKEVFFYDSTSANLGENICKILDNYLSKGGDLQNGIQILIPMYAGVAGINEINRLIQEKYNDSSKKHVVETNQGIRVFKQNDKVLQLKNDRELDIMNGDIGRIIDIIKVEEKTYLMIDFDGLVVKYPSTNLENLALAYAISIHKSQGSEFDNVIVPILNSYNIMLKPKILYTAFTRAKKKLIILGKVDAINHALTNVDDLRQSTLSYRINEEEVESKYERINDSSIPFEFLGEDLNGLTPYDFMNKE